MNNKTRKVLIANRGEIALRIQRAALKLKIEPIIALSEVDAAGYVGRNAHKFVILGPGPVAQSYTNIEKIIALALENGCDAIHPGYGFLSERADFAKAVTDAGLTWIGPSAESISALGSKTAARAVATANSVPVASGSAGELNDAQLIECANTFGYPVLIKAVAGGGGRGMRKAFSAAELAEQLPRARGEAKKNFGSDDVFLEQLIIEPRHVEVQIFGDSHGNVVSFGTRDCSAQRRHQKVIEEGPAPFIAAGLLEKIEQAAVRVAKAVGYTNAGTAEFLLSGEQFFFLEMNTRIQVEHPVTEEITGVDLVELQFRVAAGEKIADAILVSGIKNKVAGHAIELRLYAEDPAFNFAPSLGVITHVKFPSFPWLRIEQGFESGDEISPFYDAMIAKLIITGDSRAQAIERAQVLSRSVELSGIVTNLSFLAWLLHESKFAQAPLDITYIDREWTAEKMATAEAILLVDPAHRSSLKQEQFVEIIELKNGSSEEPASAFVSITHEQGKTFLVSSLAVSTLKAEPAQKIRSNSRALALQGFKEHLSVER